MTEGTGKGFKVEDRRRFSSETGEPREEGNESQILEKERENRPVDDEPNQGSYESVPPALNFSTFVISLSTQAFVHLGEVPDPVSGQVARDLGAARQIIDILGILCDKTRKNLDQQEEKLLEEILYDLRIRYVEAVKKQ